MLDGIGKECRKLLLAELLRAPAVIEFDNLTGDLVVHKRLSGLPAGP